MYFITIKRMLEVCFSAHPNIQYRSRIYGKTGISEKSERRKDRRVPARRTGKPLPQCGDRVASRDCQYSDQ